MPTFVRWAVLGACLVCASLLLAWVSTRLTSLSDWMSFLGMFLLVAGVLWAGWKAVKADSDLGLPNWLAWLLLGAVLLRLAIGVVWFLALPAWGYGSQVEQAGYVMSDAHARDTAAWALSQSDYSLWTSFNGKNRSDQYGGLLFLSALVYRYLGGDTHQPLLMVVLTASFSALAVLFTWAFAQRAWGGRAAGIAAWFVTLYPEALLLASSQMREALLMALSAAAFYGWILYWQKRTWVGLGWLLGALILSLPLSPPMAAMMLGLLVVQTVAVGDWKIIRQKKLWIVLGVAALLATFGIMLTWRRFAPEHITNPVELVGWWWSQTTRWQIVFAKHSSVLIRKTLKLLPGWIHPIILMGYGVVQPFLPAAIVESGAPLWHAIAIWRALGWALFLPVLIFGLAKAWSDKRASGLEKGISLAVWLSILFAALRGGGDQWDNPRYRVIFIGLQSSLIAWVWLEQLRSSDPWLRRVVISLGLGMGWFLFWYLGRYSVISWPVTDFFTTIGLGAASVFLYLIWDWRRGAGRR